MSQMDHAAAHERIADLLLEPARLAGLDRSADPDDVALREHLGTCRDCREDLETWRRLGRAVGQALPTDTAAAIEAVEPIEVPPSLRARVIGAVHDAAQEGATREGGVGAPVSLQARRAGMAERRARRLAPWLGLAASLIVIVGASWITLDQVQLRSAAEAEATELTKVVAAVDRVLASPHKIVELRHPDGASAGSISWSRHDWVVLTTALTEPPADQRYKCWLVEADRSALVGQMFFAGGTAYWVGSLDEWATPDIGADTQFVVTLEAADAQVRTSTPVLSADLGS
jgi:Anti-sigma-K factor rskA